MEQNIPPHIQQACIDFQTIFLTVDKILNDWEENGNYQIPLLIANLSTELNWTLKQIKQYDPIVRQYLRKHPLYHITAGAGGGVMRISDKLKKQELISAKMKAREEVQAELDAKVAAMKSQ